MKNVILVLVGLFCLMGAQGLEAQQYPFSKDTLSQTAGALAIELGQQDKFHVQLDSFVVAMNLMFRDLKLEHRTDLARHLRTLTEYDCADVARGQKIPFARTRAQGMIDLSGVWQRDCRPGEKLLCSEERCEISTWCWNILVGQFAPPRPAPAPRQPAFPVSPIIRTMAPDTVIGYVDRDVEVPIQQESSRTPWWRQKRFTIPTGIAVGLGVWCALDLCGGDINLLNEQRVRR